MRIVQVNNSFETFTSTSSGAIASHIWEVCRAAKAEAVETTVISRAATEPALPGVPLIPISVRQPIYGSLPWKAGRLIRKVFGWRDALQMEYARKVSEILARKELGRAVAILHNDPELAVYLRQRFRSLKIVHHFHNPVQCTGWFANKFAEAVNVVTAVSGYVAAEIQSIYKVAKVHTVHNGVDLERFRPADEVSDGPLLLNFLGRTGIEKGADLLLRAAIALRQEGHHLRVQIIGSNHWGRFELDEYQKSLRALCDTLQQLDVEVIQCGHQTRASIPEKLQTAQVHVLPSRWDEPCALSLLEGMATGLAVVASKTGGTPEILGDSGRLFERDSVEGLQAQLRDLILNPHERKRLGEAARKRAEHFSWAKCWEGFSPHVCRAH